MSMRWEEGQLSLMHQEKMFNEFDTDHDASLSAAELEELLLQLGASASPVAEILQKFDQDGSGSVSYFRFWCCATILTPQGMRQINLSEFRRLYEKLVDRSMQNPEPRF
eukprot:COSAG01_NODE_309_length_19142_cov_22.748149_6_plen_109_part_00